ncbi:hypothetical protein MPER_09034 [Moniliophthora perniciosa FA553]|nr:hypothetical protein MPER_09034 [Moniliophthora perniciosa FA553]
MDSRNLSRICQQAYLPGEFFAVPALPNVTEVNVLGTYYAKDRPDTLLRPFKLIPGAVHHWDENGLENLEDEPEEIRKIHEETIEFVMEWLKDWNKY